MTLPETEPEEARIRGEKARLRTAARQARESLASAERQAAEEAIHSATVQLLSQSQVGSILGYRSVGHEASIDQVLEELLAAGARVYLPRVSAPGELEVVEIGDLPAACRPGRFGVLEPAGAAISTLSGLECVLTPGLAFDRAGRRLGFGGGYYDRLLARLGAAVLRVGIAFERQIVPAVPSAPWDQPVHWLVTESGATQCRWDEGGAADPGGS